MYIVLQCTTSLAIRLGYGGETVRRRAALAASDTSMPWLGHSCGGWGQDSSIVSITVKTRERLAGSESAAAAAVTPFLITGWRWALLTHDA